MFIVLMAPVIITLSFQNPFADAAELYDVRRHKMSYDTPPTK